MVGNMKTTIDIPDSLLQAAKALASQQSVTLRDLLEEGLRQALEKRQKGEKFTLKEASFKGNGLQQGVSEGDWEAIRGMIYERRGA
jgi:hypothetical protein